MHKHSWVWVQYHLCNQTIPSGLLILVLSMWLHHKLEPISLNIAVETDMGFVK